MAPVGESVSVILPLLIVGVYVGLIKVGSEKLPLLLGLSVHKTVDVPPSLVPFSCTFPPAQTDTLLPAFVEAKVLTLIVVAFVVLPAQPFVAITLMFCPAPIEADAVTETVIL